MSWWGVTRAVSRSSLVHVVIAVLVVRPQTTVVEGHHVLQPVGQGRNESGLQVGGRPPVMTSVRRAPLESIGSESQLSVVSITTLITGVIRTLNK